MKKSLKKLGSAIKAHKKLSAFVIIIIVIGGYYSIKKAVTPAAVPQYALSPARIGNIRQVVTGTGQVSAENQLDVTSEVSGKILSIPVNVGDHVKKGDLLATIDPHDALVDLENARISYEKLTKPAKAGDVTIAQNTQSKAYTDAYTAITNSFLDLPTVLSGLKDLFYSKSGYLSNQFSESLTSGGQQARFAAGQSYDKAADAYTNIFADYKKLSLTSSRAEIEAMLTETQVYVSQVAEVLKLTQTAVNFITVSQPDYNASSASGAASNVTSWSNTITGDLSNLISAKNSILTSTDSLSTLLEGADVLDIQSSQIALQQKEAAYQKYFIRAPFDGVVGRIPVSVYGEASGSTVIATLIGDQKKAVISLNEVDAAKVSSGEPVTITFDAIDGLNATGTVASVDQVGTVSQGVVSYGVKVIINTSDARIKPGMSVNTSIVTSEKDNVLVVPTSAIKTVGNRKFVQVLDTGVASSTRGFTISSSATPRQVPVTLGDSDDTNTEIVSGISPGQLVVTRTIAASAGTTAAPNILSSLGGNRAGGAVRTGGAAGAAPANRTFAR
jgi:multidrug efflux pump subunit AcrA (membrane-fusion protein)